jgi:hypothetical protein
MREEDRRMESQSFMNDQKVSFITFETIPSKHCSYLAPFLVERTYSYRMTAVQCSAVQQSQCSVFSVECSAHLVILSV